MGEAVPHPHSHEGTHVDAHDEDQLGSYHAGQTDVADADASDGDRPNDSASYAVHAHVIGDLTRPADWVRAPTMVDGPSLVVTVVAYQPSRGVAPLLEPPSA